MDPGSTDLEVMDHHMFFKHELAKSELRIVEATMNSLDAQAPSVTASPATSFDPEKVRASIKALRDLKVSRTAAYIGEAVAKSAQVVHDTREIAVSIKALRGLRAAYLSEAPSKSPPVLNDTLSELAKVRPQLKREHAEEASMFTRITDTLVDEAVLRLQFPDEKVKTRREQHIAILDAAHKANASLVVSYVKQDESGLIAKAFTSRPPHIGCLTKTPQGGAMVALEEYSLDDPGLFHEFDVDGIVKLMLETDSAASWDFGVYHHKG